MSEECKKEKKEKPTISTEELFKEMREIHIVHREEVYRLRITSNDKLILTK